MTSILHQLLWHKVKNIVYRGMQQYHNFKEMWKSSDRRTKVTEVREMLKLI